MAALWGADMACPADSEIEIHTPWCGVKWEIRQRPTYHLNGTSTWRLQQTIEMKTPAASL